jgi:hypothetical protein
MAHSIGADLDGLAPAAPVGHVSRPPVIAQTASHCTYGRRRTTVASQTRQRKQPPDCHIGLLPAAGMLGLVNPAEQNKLFSGAILFEPTPPWTGKSQSCAYAVSLEFGLLVCSSGAQPLHLLGSSSSRKTTFASQIKSTAYLDCRESGKRDRQSSPRILGYMGYVEPCGGLGEVIRPGTDWG